MNNGLSNRDVSTIMDVFKQHPEVGLVYIFGSRVMGNYKKGSDIDLAIMNEGVSRETVSKLRASFEDSSLPYFVDLIDYPSLEQAAMKHHIDRVGLEFYKK